MKIMKACRNTQQVNECANTRIVENKDDARAEACKHIQSAIQCLGKVASSDDVAKDSIANLGVVMLDLNN